MLDGIIIHLFGFGCGVLAVMVVLYVRDKLDLAQRASAAAAMGREGTPDSVAAGVPRRSPIARLLLIVAAGGIGILAVQLAPCCVFGFLMGRNESRGLGSITESEAITVFRKQRAACERLRDMLQEDRVVGSVENEKKSLAAARYADYERLLTQIGAYRVTGHAVDRSYYTCEIHLASHGNFFHCAYAAFVFVPSGTAPPDRPPTGDDPDFHRFTPLGDGWFLHYYTM